MRFSEPELIQLCFTSLASSRGWSRKARQPGRLSHPSKKSSLGGYHSRNTPLSLSEPCTSRGAWHHLSDLPAHRAPYDDVDTHISLHTPLSSADSGALRVTLLNFSPSFSSPVLPLSWQELLSPLPPAITLFAVSPLLSPFQLLAVIPAPPCFLLSLSLFIQPCQALNI